MRIHFFLKWCVNKFVSFPFSSSFSGRVPLPFSCIGNRGFCFPFRCLHNWEEIGRCFFPTQKCCRR
uniref:Beta-defensin-like domain-containing protein n=1 Tax=Ursus americanus TaxID=9643 RepID=A0A452R2Y6_URSAM